MGRNIVVAMGIGMLGAVVFFLVWQAFADAMDDTMALPTAVSDAIMLTEEVIGTVLPTNTAVPEQPAASSAPQTYSIQAGDTLFSIARAHDMTLIELAAANGIANPDLIEVGQVLTIPNDAPPGETAVQSETLPAAETAGEPARQVQLNGVPVSSIVIMPENVVANARNIFVQGQSLGNNPHAFSKVGDSTIQNPYFLARFDQPGGYNLGDYAYLQPTIDYFSGSHSREGMAVRKGFHSWTVTDPAWADKTYCQPNETPIACEIRLHRPSILLIRLGSNDAGVPDMFDQNLRQIVELAIVNGVIPVIGTKADRAEGSNINNDILRRIAADYQIPLWDFDVAAGTIPGRGLDVDYVHLTTFYAHDYTSPTAFRQGHSVHNLTALIMLDALLNQVILGAGG